MLSGIDGLGKTVPRGSGFEASIEETGEIVNVFFYRAESREGSSVRSCEDSE